MIRASLVLSGLSSAAAILTGLALSSPTYVDMICTARRCYEPYPAGFALWMLWLAISVGIFVSGIVFRATVHAPPSR